MERLMRRLNGSLSRSVRRSVQDVFQQSPLDLRFALQKTLDPRVTFTRASTGTYVGSDGLIKSAVTNLVLQSEDFSTTWATSGTPPRVGITVNQAAAPNGANTADLAVPNAVSNDHVLFQSNIINSSSTVYTQTLYAKAAGYSCLQLLFTSAFNNADAWANFILTGAGSVGFTGSATTATIEALPNQWYRCRITASSGTSVSNAGFALIPLDSNRNSRNPTFTGDGTSGIYIWGAQLEQSSTVGEYVPTTSTINSAPRFDHNPTTGESLGLLVEEARTNLLLQSQDFTTAWSQTNVTITPNTTTSPDGSANAETLLINSVGATTSQITQSFTAGSTITISVFAKKNASNFVRFEIGSVCNCWFNLDTGVTATNGAGSGNVLFSAKSIQPYGNGWYRCVLTVTTTTITTLGVSIFATNADGTTSSIGSSIFLWGAEAEAGAVATSYIPTTTAAVTRSADVASISGSNFSSWYRQDEGTMFAEAISVATNTSVYGISDNTTSNRIQLETGSNTRRFRITSSGAARYDNSVSYTFGTQGKTAGAYLTTNANHATNGTLGSNSTASPLPVVDRIYIGSSAVSAIHNNGTIKRLTYWPTRLSNTTLQQITQP